MYFHDLDTILIIFDTKFMLSSDQMCVTKHSLEISKTLARFRDPTWCSHTQLIGRIWLCVQHWSPGEHQSILGTLFANIDFKFLNYINSVFTQFNLPNPFKWTLVLLVCLYTHHGRLPNERTRIFYKNSLWNGYIFRESMWNTQWEIMIFHDFHEFHMYYYDTTLFMYIFGLVGCSQVMLSLK